MEVVDQTHKLLEEIRDVQREHLAEYRRVTRQLLELQERGVARQQQAAIIYKRIVSIGGVLVAVLLMLLMYLLIRWAPQLFR